MNLIYSPFFSCKCSCELCCRATCTTGVSGLVDFVQLSFVIYLEKMKMILGAGEIIQSIKHLSYKCEDLGLNFQNPHKAGMVIQSQNFCSKIGGGDRGSPASL